MSAAPPDIPSAQMPSPLPSVSFCTHRRTLVAFDGADVSLDSLRQCARAILRVSATPLTSRTFFGSRGARPPEHNAAPTTCKSSANSLRVSAAPFRSRTILAAAGRAHLNTTRRRRHAGCQPIRFWAVACPIVFFLVAPRASLGARRRRRHASVSYYSFATVETDELLARVMEKLAPGSKRAG